MIRGVQGFTPISCLHMDAPGRGGGGARYSENILVGGVPWQTKKGGS